MRIALIDNYDSFTFNLVHYFGALGASVDVMRNDTISVDSLLRQSHDAIVLSPGPGTPDQAGICCDLIVRAGAHIPILGVCLGHQAIGQVYGGVVRRANLPMHGKLSDIIAVPRGLFAGIDGPFRATRYHSLVVDEASLPSCLEITARADTSVIMGLSHRSHPVHGVQFHPESIASEHGHRILGNFLEMAQAWNVQSRMTA